MMIGQCPKEHWIIVWSLFNRNVKIEHELVLNTHTCIGFLCINIKSCYYIF